MESEKHFLCQSCKHLDYPSSTVDAPWCGQHWCIARRTYVALVPRGAPADNGRCEHFRKGRPACDRRDKTAQ